MADLSLVESTTRKQLLALLEGGNSHASLTEALHGLPENLRGVKPNDAPYSIWQLVDHIRVVQWDVLKLSTNLQHTSPKWPDAYWPKNAAPKSEEEWQNSIDQILSDRQKFIDLVSDEDVDLFEPFATEENETIFRFALMMADHNSYHIGQIVLMRRMLNSWK
ncbi:DinB family protein [Mucilaginibacter sp. HMF5004]|uniref:DinB family protein n=1 Tax=Mucilaginibacter rivuli TaxID=2857527 RepID=UPI001C5E0375|nr:DinB family protein [Mucilaginibacter rivuli]MBW4891403.1 DinB family protein [Mucilaginibacter rivuli]